MLSNSVLKSFVYLGQFAIIIPVIVIFFRYRNYNRTFRLMALLILISFGVSVLAYWLFSQGKNNYPVLHVFTIVEMILWTAVYYHMFSHKKIKKGLIILGILFVGFSIINTLFWQNIYTFNTNNRSIEALILFILAIAWFYKAFTEKNIPRLEKHPFFWINAGVLVYFSSTFLLFAFQNLMENQTKEQLWAIWSLHGLFLFFHYLLISIGLWLKKAPKY